MPSAATPVEGKVEAETPNSTSSSTAAAVYSEGGDARKMQTVCKYLLFSVNCIACVCGLVLFFFGVILEAKHATYFDFLHTSFYAVAVVVGVAVCLVSFLGLYGSIKEDYCALLAFSIILSLVIAFEICLGVSAFALAQENRLTSAVAEKLEQSLDNYGRRGHEGVTKIWDILQTDFDCCGVSFPGDWSMTHWARNRDSVNREHTSTALPSSCCSNALALGSEQCAVDSEDRNAVGCIDALATSSRRNAGTLGGIACVLGMGQIVLVVTACRLMRGVKKPPACPPFY